MRSVSLVTRFVGAMAVFGLCAQPLFALAATPNDSEYDALWYLDTIQAEEAWETTTGSRDIVVAVLDTGVDLDHPDLVGNIWINDDEIAENSVDDDRNGYVDDVHGWDFVQDDNSPVPQPYGSEAAISHGTAIAGIIGASGNNGIGTSGILWDVQIMSARMLNASGAGDTLEAAAAIDYAVANGADVINLSFAGERADEMLRRSIERAYDAGVVIVAAMGNDAVNTEDVPIYPACLRSGNEDWVIGVASSAMDDTGSSFSNYGSTCTDISAPGEGIFSTIYYDPAEDFLRAYAGGWTGTSLAAPMVAGSVALLLAAYPDLSVDEVRNALKLSVDPMVLARSLRGKFGAGRLNVARALAVAAQYAEAAGAVPEEAEESAVEPVPAVSKAVVVQATTAGSLAVVDVQTAQGATVLEFAPYGPSFSGGVRVAVGDVDGDGDADVVTGAGAGGGPHVRAFTAQGALLGEFFPFSAASRAGVEIALGDVDGDGVADVVAAVGAGVSQEIVVADYRGTVKQRFTSAAFAPTDALRVAVGDVDGDGKGEIIVAGGKGSAPRVAVYDDNGTYLLEFAPYAASFLGGVYVATGDVDGDGKDEIVTGTGEGGGPHVRVFTRIGAVLHSFFAYDAATRHGVRVATADIDRDGVDDILAAPGVSMTEVRVFDRAGAQKASWNASRTGTEGTAIAAW